MDTANAYLIALGRHIAAAYLTYAQPAAILLTGSAAEDESDFYSDLDVIMYDAVLPSDAALRTARAQNQGRDFRVLGPRTDTQVAEDYFVNGVECQVVHTTIAAWEADMAGVLRDLDMESPIQKALGGLLGGIPLHGEARIGEWQARAAAYADALPAQWCYIICNFGPFGICRSA